MKWAVIFLMFIGSGTLSGAGESMASAQPDIYLSSDIIPQGYLALIKVTVKKGESPHVSWLKRPVFLVPNIQKTDWFGFLAADLTARPGQYKVLVRIRPTGQKRHVNIKVRKKDYGVRRLTLPKKMVDLDPETLKRVKKESKIMKGLWEPPPPSPVWKGPFLRPVPGEVKGPFGRRSVINNQPRSPHSGVDLKAEKNSPIRAINNGRVALTADHFFTGRTVVIDHGGGIQSMYFHLEKILVKKSGKVSKGQIIGLAGSTGRATGSHLHWGIRINGARVDPLGLTGLSQQIEE